MTEKTLVIHIDFAVAPVWCRQCAVAAYVGAGRGCGIVRCRAGFGIIIGRNRNVNHLVEVFQGADPRSAVAGWACPGDEVQGVMNPVVTGDIGERAAGRRTSVAGGAVLQGQGRTGQVAGCTGRAYPVDTVQVGAVTKGAGNGKIGGVAMGNRAAPGDGFRSRRGRVGCTYVVTVLTTVDQ